MEEAFDLLNSIQNPKGLTEHYSLALVVVGMFEEMFSTGQVAAVVDNDDDQIDLVEYFLAEMLTVVIVDSRHLQWALSKQNWQPH